MRYCVKKIETVPFKDIIFRGRFLRRNNPRPFGKGFQRDEFSTGGGEFPQYNIGM